MNIVVLLLIIISLNVIICKESPVVETYHGFIKGSILKASHNPELEYYAFRGIPYAKPPLGKLRFQPPQEPAPWKGIKVTQKYGNPCAQINENIVSGSEDCLTINVFTKNLSPKALRPVMFWIHGGAHSRGNSSTFGPDYLLEKDIVYVSINYRLNVFGFLSVNDKNAYGNIAFKDQIAGLKWVQKNIAKFGGDPKKVTIFGYSSGSDSTSILSISPIAKGLFQQVICESGSSLNPRYLQLDPLKYTYNLAKYFNISTATTKSIIEGLQQINYEDLVKAAFNPEATGHKITLEALPFFPIIEVNHPDAVITRSPYEILEEGKFEKLPFLMGHNSGEASLGFKIVYEVWPINDLKDNSHFAIKQNMDIKDFDKKNELFYTQSLKNPSRSKEIGAYVRNHYLGNELVENNIEGISKFLSQEIIVRGMRKDLEFRRKLGVVYFYIMSYEGTITSDYAGAGHGEETNFLFDRNAVKSESDDLHRKRMVELWTNFAIYGNPTPKKDCLLQKVIWEKCDKTNVPYLDIGKDLKLGSDPEQDEYIFWKQTFEKYATPPLLTY